MTTFYLWIHEDEARILDFGMKMCRGGKSFYGLVMMFLFGRAWLASLFIIPRQIR